MVTDSVDRRTISVDTNVIGLIVGLGPTGSEYRRLLEGCDAAITYFVQAEIRASDWPVNEQVKLDAFLRTARYLPPLGPEGIEEFARLKRTSVALGLRYGTEREDLWMLAQSRSLGLIVATNDRNAARVAQATGMRVATALRDIERDYARDRQRLERLRRV
ncbi:MAG: hypothetical protein OXD50_13875 [Chloroflexi bacterium]|nr:hypothetical protein [Chloroflexota bacterium]